jgi:predicted DNA-binding transcriptional regulator YafY
MSNTTVAQIASTVATYDAIRAAIAQRAPLDVVYATGGVEAKQRTIRPVSIEVGNRGSDIVVAEDSLRGTILTFRVDRFVAVSTPVEVRL